MEESVEVERRERSRTVKQLKHQKAPFAVQAAPQPGHDAFGC